MLSDICRDVPVVRVEVVDQLNEYDCAFLRITFQDGQQAICVPCYESGHTPYIRVSPVREDTKYFASIGGSAGAASASRTER